MGLLVRYIWVDILVLIQAYMVRASRVPPRRRQVKAQYTTSLAAPTASHQQEAQLQLQHISQQHKAHLTVVGPFRMVVVAIPIRVKEEGGELPGAVDGAFIAMKKATMHEIVPIDKD
mmetsp:Transcript_17497/g.30131  ORF Transcript_17497/g.30131 Transcript_17497/m.30131 type:complete len:117 (+) Transcript_17497:1128-1478(+)